MNIKEEKKMPIITEEEKEKALEYHLQGWDNCQITQQILRKRGDAIYHDMYLAVSWTVADVKVVQ